MFDELKEQVYKENKRLVSAGLVLLTWGNASAYDDTEGVVVIKPSGVDYETMKAEDMVAVDLDGNVVEGSLRPSSDLPTHLEIYRNFKGVRGVVHTHSIEATARAQAGRELPCYGTTHADIAHGSIPMTRGLSEVEVSGNYELNTGKVIVERFAAMDPLATPMVLVCGHGPFTWGTSVSKAVDNAIALEAVAKMARLTEAINPAAMLPRYVAEKHYQRKHGPHAYYGQK